MTADSWIIDSIGKDKLRAAEEEATRRRLESALGVEVRSGVSDEDLRFVADALELRAFALLDGDNVESLREAAARAFQVARTLPLSVETDAGATGLLRVACLGILGDRGADVRRILGGVAIAAPAPAASWGHRVAQTILEIWLRLLRKQGWDDLDGVQNAVARLRAEQREGETTFLAEAERNKDARPAWGLMSQYHLAKAAEILGTYLTQGSVDGHYDVREQLEAQFDRAIDTAAKGRLMEREVLARLLARTARTLVENSIWTVTRAVRRPDSGSSISDQ